ncbi:MAG: phosphate ABC transporter ATP-binding protein [Solirubrobacteraceae bacterium]|nr:phosphate ABC transporter ATP-binding protein [Solirubrobacteraceae bacterium]
MDPEMPTTFPPPVRRITLDRTPTVVDPSVEPIRHTPVDRAHERGDQRERMTIDDLVVKYAGKPAVKGVTLPIRDQEVLALIGPSGCGKSTLLRTLNRLTELTPGATYEGRIALDGQDVRALPVTQLRRKVSMVFQQPNPFPMSIFDNVAYAVKEQSKRAPKKSALMPKVESALRRAGLWDEVASDLDRPALRLSGGQQQRLCIARALAVEPEVMLMDEPCSALDPKSTMVIEELIRELRKSLSVVIVTHNLAQARRVGDHVAFMYLGDLVEYAPAEQLFTDPRAERTREYVSGSFG